MYSKMHWGTPLYDSWNKFDSLLVNIYIYYRRWITLLLYSKNFDKPKKKKKSYHTPDYKTSDFSSQILLLVT